MCQILVHAPRLALGAPDGYVHCLGVVEQVVAAFELVVKHGITPRRNDGDGRLQSVEGEFESNLIVALACTSVRHGEAALLLRNGNLSSCRHGTSKRCAEKVDVLVDGVALDCGEALLFYELYAGVSQSVMTLDPRRDLLVIGRIYLSAKILNVDLAGSNLQSLLSDSVKILLLANVGRKGDDFISFFLDNISAGALNTKAVAMTHQQVFQYAARV